MDSHRFFGLVLVLFLHFNIGCLNAAYRHQPAAPGSTAAAVPTPDQWVEDCEVRGQELFPTAHIVMNKIPSFDLALLEWKQRKVGIDVQQPLLPHLVGWKKLEPEKAFVGQVITRLSLFNADVKTMQHLRTIPSGMGLSFTEVGWDPDASGIPDAWTSHRLSFAFRRKTEKKRSSLLFEIVPFAVRAPYVPRHIEPFTNESQTVPYSLAMFNGLMIPSLEKDGIVGAAVVAMLPIMHGTLQLDIETVELMDAEANSLGCIHAAPPKDTVPAALY